MGLSSDVFSLMKEADAMCLSSICEGLPITLLEAMCIGCIPICTPDGGILDVILDKQNGILSKGVSCKVYKEAVIRFLNLSPTEPGEMSAKMYISSKYKISKTSMEYEELYAKISHSYS